MDSHAFPRLAMAAALAAGLSAQTQFDHGPLKRHLPVSTGNDCAVAAGDVDGDGDLDLVVGRFDFAGNLLYLGDGQGRFQLSPGLPPNRDDTWSVALADLDGDLDLDLLVGNFSRRNQLFLNDGQGRFTDATAARLPADTAITWDFAAGDVDGDGDTDLFLANGGPLNPRQSFLYLNDGTGRFTDATSGRLPALALATAAAALLDVDRDNDLDLVLVNSNAAQANPQANRLYLNDGHGWFSDATATHFPGVTGYGNSVAHGDVDGDGDPDLVFGNGAWRPNGRQTTLYLNSGAGVFVDGTSRVPVDSEITHAALADVDGDGDLDIVCASSGATSRLYLNDGVGQFATAPAGAMPATTTSILDVVTGDFDGDRLPDLLAAGSPAVLWLNNHAGGYHDATQPRVPSGLESGPARLGDLDCDGDLDAVVAHRDGALLLSNDSRGRFTQAAGILPGGTDVRNLALADVDGDGDLDIALAAWEQQNRLYRNDGDGRFVDVTGLQLPPDVDRTEAAVFADVDGDHDLDLILGNCGQDRLYRNDGAGRFTDVTAGAMPVESVCATVILAGDVDRDGDVDLVLGSSPNRLYLNDGAGRFTDATAGRLPGTTFATSSMALVDLDADGDPDLVVINNGCWPYGEDPDQVYLNDGTGTFSLAATQVTGSAAVAAGDLDGDGDQDLLTTSTCELFNNVATRLFLNDGTGRLSVASNRIPAGVLDIQNLALGDLDADGDLDVFGPGLVNGRRQLAAPYLLRLGRAYALDLSAEPGYGTALHVALVALADAPASLPVPPFGILGVDPARAVFLPLVQLPAPAGQARVQIDVPDDAQLLGLRLHSQALLFDLQLLGGLTNVVLDVVGR